VDTSAPGVTVLELHGEHDMSTDPRLRSALDDALGAGDGLVVDLTGAAFVDSSVIHALFDARAALEARGRRLVIQVGTPSVVMRALELTDLTASADIALDRAQAVTLAGRQEEPAP
jgi:anti-anti-sigma factor